MGVSPREKMLDAQWFAGHLQDRSMRGIAIETAAMIRSGVIEIGTHLPAVRELALALGVSPATVSAAWGQLRRQKVIAGRGRNGVWVCGDTLSPRPARFEKIGNFGDHIIADLALSSPDPQLLPKLEQALLSGVEADHLNSYQREAISQVLLDAVKPSWPYPADAFMAADGGFDAMNLTLQTLIMQGSVVAIEDPTATRLLDMLDNIGAQVIPVKCDEFGPVPESLQQALSKNPAAFIYQPRTHSHCGHAISPTRLTTLAEILTPSQTLIIEDDGIGQLSNVAAQSMGSVLPKRTVHVRSYSKAYGPDLRMAVISSSHDLIKQIKSFRNFGAGWSSRILQHALAWLIKDDSTQQGIAYAKIVYAQRRQALVDALAARGLTLPKREGLAVWIPVPSEQFALVTLAARGIAVLPGERSRIGPGQFIRVSTSQLQLDQVEIIADAIILAMG
ncbi:MAG: aminotransferase class I/II-fold pyridoxal phosphate-dependent enzyme [Rouxiella aceris]|uniref:aminotransferase class I/II-fold pyridoxal phosphate-dependent enzyme n=1 Tax=Rouxiella aceris TaxID=2703884 RepID=UPI002844A5AD|nr:aminotransferase class I/II-fold pyridoxal phosphate-dependent enzyme [Rouxiella aceris]MDR3433955.1 aminotransferase class I/II-fold pyridoxal phosphate-dependent enzyme [Rouxiella aceris]